MDTTSWTERYRRDPFRRAVHSPPHEAAKLILLFAACVPEINDDASDTCVLTCEGDADSDADADPGRRFDHFVFTTEAYVGDDSCAGDDPVEPDAACREVVTVTGGVVDFQTEDEVAEAAVEWWIDDDPTGSVDVEAATGRSGQFELSTFACQPMSIITSTLPEWEATVDTLQQHRVYAWESDGEVLADAFSVSEVTTRLLPGILGVEWDRDSAMVLGTVLDCGGEPVEHAQVFVHDDRGDGAPDAEVYYFDDYSFPATRDEQPDASDNGQWLALNLPDGEWTADAWGWDGSDYVRLGSTPLLAREGAVTLIDIQVNTDEGVVWPDSCLDACGGR
ncbi:MAG: hypothetical protein EXR71_18365 [Myxococcales bacterium]|nr:hypothetical protein [Myxococcales bacterium]